MDQPQTLKATSEATQGQIEAREMLLNVGPAHPAMHGSFES